MRVTRGSRGVNSTSTSTPSQPLLNPQQYRGVPNLSPHGLAFGTPYIPYLPHTVSVWHKRQIATSGSAAAAARTARSGSQAALHDADVEGGRSYGRLSCPSWPAAAERSRHRQAHRTRPSSGSPHRLTTSGEVRGGPIPTADPLPTPPLPLQAAAPAAALTETNSTLDSHTDANTASDTTTLDA